jgi:hypothetical protein
LIESRKKNIRKAGPLAASLLRHFDLRIFDVVASRIRITLQDLGFALFAGAAHRIKNEDGVGVL